MKLRQTGWQLTAVASLIVGSSTVSGCALLPQDSTEWIITGVISGVLIVGVIAIAIYASREADDKPDD